MKITLKNVGPIRNGELELGKLTMVVGGNNTGKTYLTYSIFGVLYYLQRSCDFGRIIDSLARAVAKDGKGIVTYSGKDFSAAITASALGFSENDFGRVFSSDEGHFPDALLALEFDSITPKTSEVRSRTVRIKDSKFSVEVTPNKTKALWEIRVTQITPENPQERISPLFLKRQLNRVLRSILLEDVIPRPFISTSERLGIALFYKDLDSNRNALVEQLQRLATSDRSNSQEIDPWDLIQKATSRFALPIHMNIDFVRDLNNVQKNKTTNQSFDLAGYVTKMMEGVYKVENDQILFSNGRRGTRKLKIPIHLGSSSLRSLADIFFYLRHEASPGDLMMIDEPESHLTPQNQIILARMIGAATNSGINVFVTTHSDYLIREINNLMMLSSVPESKKKTIFKSYGYLPEEELSVESVKAYECRDGAIEECHKTAFGIETQILDNAILSLNERTHHLIDIIEGDISEL